MIPSVPTDTRGHDDGHAASAGLLFAVPPTAEQIAAFEAAMREANARFLAAALYEDGMPISAGWCGAVAEPSSRSPANRPDAANLGGVAPPG